MWYCFAQTVLFNYMDIDSRGNFPAASLSNFAKHAFVFDGVGCASMEGLLQSFKYDDVDRQIEICKLVGRAAQLKGQERNEAWKSKQTLWWKGESFDRHGPEYQQLLTRAYDALGYQNVVFRAALIYTLVHFGAEELTHSVGNPDPKDTILTEKEFCGQLMRLRPALFDYVERELPDILRACKTLEEIDVYHRETVRFSSESRVICTIQIEKAMTIKQIYSIWLKVSDYGDELRQLAALRWSELVNTEEEIKDLFLSVPWHFEGRVRALKKLHALQLAAASARTDPESQS